MRLTNRQSFLSIALACMVYALFTACSENTLETLPEAFPPSATWRWELPKPTGEQLNDVWVSPTGVIYAVGNAGTIVRRVNGAWELMDCLATDDLLTIDGVSDDAIIAAGENGVIMGYNGRYWYHMDSHGYRTLNSIWMASPSLAYGGGNFGLIFEFDGTVWSQEKLDFDSPVYTVHGTSPDNVWIGTADGQTARFDGNNWIMQPLMPEDYDVQGLYTLGPSNTFVAAYNVFHFDGTSWEINTAVDGVFQIAGRSGSDIFVSGWSLGYHFDGTDWLRLDCPVGNYYHSDHDGGVAMGPDFASILSTDGWIISVRDTCEVLRERWNIAFNDIVAFAPDDIWAAGDWTYHFDGAEWSAFPEQRWVSAISARAPNDVYALQRYGSLYHFNGTEWFDHPFTARRVLLDMWLAQETDDGWAVGEDGALVRIRGTTTTPHIPAIEHWLYGVWGSSAENVYAVGSHGAVIHFDGQSWSPVAEQFPDLRFYTVWGRSPDDVYIGGVIGIVHWDGESWTFLDGTFGPTYHDIFGLDSGEIIAVGEGSVASFDGYRWRFQRTTSSALTSVWMFSPTEAVAVGYGGIMHYGYK